MKESLNRINSKDIFSSINEIGNPFDLPRKKFKQNINLSPTNIFPSGDRLDNYIQMKN